MKKKLLATLLRPRCRQARLHACADAKSLKDYDGAGQTALCQQGSRGSIALKRWLSIY